MTIHLQRWKKPLVTQFSSYTDTDEHTHLNMHCVNVAETSTHSVLKILLSVVSNILLTW